MSSVGDGVGAVSYEHSCALGMGLVFVWRWISIRILLQWLCQAGRQWSEHLPSRQCKNELVTEVVTPLPLLDKLCNTRACAVYKAGLHLTQSDLVLSFA